MRRVVVIPERRVVAILVRRAAAILERPEADRPVFNDSERQRVMIFWNSLDLKDSLAQRSNWVNRRAENVML